MSGKGSWRTRPISGLSRALSPWVTCPAFWLLRGGSLGACSPPFSRCISKAPSSVSPLLCPPEPLKLLPSNAALRGSFSLTQAMLCRHSDRIQASPSLVPGGAAWRTLGQLQEVGRGTRGPLGPLAVCSLGGLTPRKEEATSLLLPGSGALVLSYSCSSRLVLSSASTPASHQSLSSGMPTGPGMTLDWGDGSCESHKPEASTGLSF